MNIFELMNLKLDFFSVIPLLTPLDQVPEIWIEVAVKFLWFRSIFVINIDTHIKISLVR